MFNEYIWQLYLDAGGKEIVHCFEQNLTRRLDRRVNKHFVDTVKSLRRAYCPDDILIEDMGEQLEELPDVLSGWFWVPKIKKHTTETTLTELYNEIADEAGENDRKVFDAFSSLIELFSTTLAVEYPKLFVPYYFKYNFNILENIAEEFDIDLPPVPVKKDYRGRFFYYGKVCKALHEFREDQGMSPAELCAFLYDFAPKYVGGLDCYIIKDLPEPKSAFFIGGSKDDAFLSYKKDYIAPWQCNPDTRAGDMIVMYLTSPESKVDSFWRSVSVGFNDPFFFYYRCTYIARPVRVKPVPLKELRNDEILGKMPIVRKNMQGINGVEFKPSEYNHLLDLTGAKLPKLEFAETESGRDLVNEKDVEDKLIKPLIKKLGYSERDYVQQLYIEIGNHNHALIPDFVIKPVTTRGHQTAFCIIEAKYSIHGHREMGEVQIQARSYARQLKVQYSVIASKDRIWVYRPDDDYTKTVFSASWDELNTADVFSQLLKLIGAR